MQEPEFEELVEGIRGRDPRFATDAYAFVFESLDCALEERGKREHIKAAELCRAFRDLALLRFGMLARVVLARWGIQSTRHVGEIVFQLIEAGAMSKRDDDRLEDFEGVMDLDQELEGHVELIEECP